MRKEDWWFSQLGPDELNIYFVGGEQYREQMRHVPG